MVKSTSGRIFGDIYKVSYQILFRFSVFLIRTRKNFFHEKTFCAGNKYGEKAELHTALFFIACSRALILTALGIEIIRNLQRDATSIVVAVFHGT